LTWCPQAVIEHGQQDGQRRDKRASRESAPLSGQGPPFFAAALLGRNRFFGVPEEEMLAALLERCWKRARRTKERSPTS
jgi:hypothetical protein